MVEKQELLTQDGYNKLEEELEYLKTVKRKEVAERLKVAISFGDLSENAEYDEAKNEQAKLEEQILKLDEKLRKAVIIDESQIDLDIDGDYFEVTLENEKLSVKNTTRDILWLGKLE